MAGELSIEHLKPYGERFVDGLKAMLELGKDDTQRARLIKAFTQAMEENEAFLKQKEHYFECLNKGIKSYEYVEPDSSDSEAEGYFIEERLYSRSKPHRRKLRRILRTMETSWFTNVYKFATGRKICVNAYRRQFSCESVKCFHSPWVAVHGMKSICFVTCQDMDMTRLPAVYQTDCMKQQNMRTVAESVISDVECIPYVDYDYNDDELRLCCKGDVKKPFIVVSCPEGDPHYHESDRAIETIQNCFPMMENRPEDHFATIQAAIKAYQAMCQRELQAEDIWVSLFHVKYGGHEDLTMDIIREQLAIVNGYSKEAPQKPLFFTCFSGMTPQKPAQKIGTTNNSNGGVQDGDPSGIPRPYGKGKQGRVRGRGESKRDGVGRVYQSDSGSQSWGSKDVEAGFRDGGWGRFRGRGGGAFDVGRRVWGNNTRSGADGGSSGWVGWGEAGRGCTRGSGSGSVCSSVSSSSRWGGSGRGDRSSDWGKKGGGDKVECGEPSGGGSLKKGNNNKNGNGWYGGSRGVDGKWSGWGKKADGDSVGGCCRGGNGTGSDPSGRS